MVNQTNKVLSAWGSYKRSAHTSKYPKEKGFHMLKNSNLLAWSQ